MSDKRFYVPPVTVEAENTPQPRLSDFTRKPASSIEPGDLLLLAGQIWRVKAVLMQHPRRTFTLHPVAGGAPTTEVYFEREWLRAVKGW